MYNIFIALFALISLFNPFMDVSIGRCIDNERNGKEYNGEPYYNYIKYDENFIHENDIVITGFILDEYGEYNMRIFDKVVLKDTPSFEVGVN